MSLGSSRGSILRFAAADSGNGLPGCLSGCQQPLGTCSALPRLGGLGLCWGRCCLLAPLSFAEALETGSGSARLASPPSRVPGSACASKAPLAAWAPFLCVLGLGLLTVPPELWKSLEQVTPPLRLRVSEPYEFLFPPYMFFEVLSENFCRDFLAPSPTEMDLLDHRISVTLCWTWLGA